MAYRLKSWTVNAVMLQYVKEGIPKPANKYA